jgi:hypothetical protein
MRTVRKALLAALAAPVAIVFLVGLVRVLELAGCGQRTHPSDRELMATFAAHRTDFEALRQMIGADRGLLRVSDRDTWPEDYAAAGVAPSRIDEYRRLLRHLGLHSVELSADGTTVELIVSVVGLVTNGSVKGYVCGAPPDPRLVVEELDRISAAGTGAGVRHIEGDWYLFFEGT